MTKRIVSNPSKPPFDRAAKKAQLEERATEGAKAISEYNAAREAERAKTERLRALRLAKEATDRTKKRRGHAMTYEALSSGFGRSRPEGMNEWAVTIRFPDASEPLARSSVVKVMDTRDEAIALAHERIHNWLKRQKLTARATSSQ